MGKHIGVPKPAQAPVKPAEPVEPKPAPKRARKPKAEK